jgi:TctA family transporter
MFDRFHLSNRLVPNCWKIVAKANLRTSTGLVLNLPLIRLWVQLLRVPHEDIS